MCGASTICRRHSQTSLHMIRASITWMVSKANVLTPLQRALQVPWLERSWQQRESVWTTYPSSSRTKLVPREERLCMTPECEQLPLSQHRLCAQRSCSLNMTVRVGFLRWEDPSAKTCRPISLDKYNRTMYNVPFRIPFVPAQGCRLVVADTSVQMFVQGYKAATTSHVVP